MDAYGATERKGKERKRKKGRTGKGNGNGSCQHGMVTLWFDRGNFLKYALMQAAHWVFPLGCFVAARFGLLVTRLSFTA